MCIYSINHSINKGRETKVVHCENCLRQILVMPVLTDKGIMQVES